MPMNDLHQLKTDVISLIDALPSSSSDVQGVMWHCGRQVLCQTCTTMCCGCMQGSRAAASCRHMLRLVAKPADAQHHCSVSAGVGDSLICWAQCMPGVMQLLRCTGSQAQGLSSAAVRCTGSPAPAGVHACAPVSPPAEPGVVWQGLHVTHGRNRHLLRHTRGAHLSQVACSTSRTPQGAAHASAAGGKAARGPSHGTGVRCSWEYREPGTLRIHLLHSSTPPHHVDMHRVEQGGQESLFRAPPGRR